VSFMLVKKYITAVAGEGFIIAIHPVFTGER